MTRYVEAFTAMFPANYHNRRCARHPGSPSASGQGLVEFALILPLLLLMMFGIIEFGRMLVIYDGVSNASREAARWGSVVGDSNPSQPGTQYYFLDCSGMRAAARRTAVLTTLNDADIAITYEKANSSGGFDQIGACVQDTQPGSSIENGYRVVVTVNAAYAPIAPLLPIPSQTFTFTAARTIFPDIAGVPQCNDGVDNDNDGQTDYPDDPGCATAADPDETTINSAAACYPLAVNISPPGSGSFITNPATDSDCIAAGYSSDYYSDFVVVSVTASPGYDFANFTGDATGSNPSATLSMTSARTITANFAARCYTLTTSIAPASAGSVSVPTVQNCAGGYTYGTAATLQAAGASGYSFSNWSGDTGSLASLTDSTTTLTMDGVSGDGTGNKVITANFEPVPCYALDATIATGSTGGGSISSIDPVNNCAGGKYNEGTLISITASPATGYQFVNWASDPAGTTPISADNPLIIAATSDLGVYANFVSIVCNALTVNVVSNGGGVGGLVVADPASSDSCPAGQYPSGTVVTLTRVVNTGYAFAGWSGAASGESSTVTVVVSSNPTVVTATFNRLCYSLGATITPGGGGSVLASPASSSGCPAGKYYAGENVTLTASPAAGYRFNSWSGAASGSTSPTTIVMPASDASVGAFFNSSCVAAGALSQPSSQVVEIDYSNYTGATRYITGITVTWPSGGNRHIKRVEFGTAPSSWSTLWNGSTHTPAVFTSFTGNTGLLDAAAKTLRLTFDFNVTLGSITVTTQFDDGC